MAKSIPGGYNTDMLAFVLNEQKGLEMRVLLAVSVCLLAVGSRTRAADPPDKVSAAKPTGEVVDREAFERLRKDRDNLLIQAKRLLKKNRELTGIKHKFGRFEKERKSLLDEKEGMTQELRVLNEEIEEEKKRSGRIVRGMAELKQLQQEMANDKQRLEKLLAEAKAESGVDKLEELIGSLKSERKGLNSQFEEVRGTLAQLEERLKKERAEFAERLEKSRIESEREIADYRSRLEGLEKKYAGEVKERKALGKELTQLPKRLAETTKESGRIIKGAADRHYNLGVFYAKKGEYRRARAEFEEALKIDPDHAFALYNLGNLYATHLVNREKAVYYFGEYLRVCPEAEDKDLVRKYIITWKSRSRTGKKSRWNVLDSVLGK